jgi:hypothetical protein
LLSPQDGDTERLIPIQLRGLREPLDLRVYIVRTR